MTQYEAKFAKLSHFAPQLITTKDEKALKFQDGPNPYLKIRYQFLSLVFIQMW